MLSAVMPKKRKRRRTRIKPAPFLALGLIVALGTGLLYSPLTSLSKVTIEGAAPADRTEIERNLATLNGIPWLQVNPRWVETRVQRIQAVDTVSYSQNPLGRGHLRITYRRPVAKIRAERPLAMDARGVIFETASWPADLPTVTRPPSAKDLTLAIAGGFPGARVAELAVKARQFAPTEKVNIWFNNQGALCLNMDAGLVILGSSEDLDLKLRALKEILEQEPDLLGKVESLNLTEPSHPARTYRRRR